MAEQAPGGRHYFFSVHWPEAALSRWPLAAEIGRADAARIYQVMAEEIVATLKAIHGPDQALWIYATPVHRVRNVLLWLNDGRPPHLDAIAQPEDAAPCDRVDKAFEWGFERFLGREVWMLGAEHPELTPDLRIEAGRRLPSTDVPLGPSTDGRIYLIGMRHRTTGLFDGLDLRSDTMRSQLEGRCTRAGLSVDTTSLPMLQPVSCQTDLANLPPETRQSLLRRANAHGFSLDHLLERTTRQ